MEIGHELFVSSSDSIQSADSQLKSLARLSCMPRVKTEVHTAGFPLAPKLEIYESTKTYIILYIYVCRKNGLECSVYYN